MSSKDPRFQKLMEGFRNYPTIRAMRERFDFQANMVITTLGTVDFVTARNFVLSDHMCGRVRPEANKRDDIVHWFFELYEDAVLFTLKFGTSLPRELSQGEGRCAWP